MEGSDRMAISPVFGKLGEPRISIEAGVIDIPCLDWHHTDAKCNVIASVIAPALQKHVHGGTYVVLRTEQAPGCVRLYWEPRGDQEKMPSKKTLARHAAKFVELFGQDQYVEKMLQALPEVEALLENTRANLERNLRETQLVNYVDSQYDFADS
jgi:hypothetical protein